MPNSQSFSRRQMLAAGAVAAAVTSQPVKAALPIAQATRDAVPADFRITNKRIRQSVMGWCFNPMPVPELIKHCADIGLEAIETVTSGKEEQVEHQHQSKPGDPAHGFLLPR